MKDVLAEINRLRIKRNWSEYELSKRANLTQSTISTWYRKNQMPTVQNLDKICAALGVTLSQFFADSGDLISLTEKQRELLDDWSALNAEQQKIISALLKNM